MTPIEFILIAAFTSGITAWVSAKTARNAAIDILRARRGEAPDRTPRGFSAYWRQAWEDQAKMHALRSARARQKHHDGRIGWGEYFGDLLAEARRRSLIKHGIRVPPQTPLHNGDGDAGGHSEPTRSAPDATDRGRTGDPPESSDRIIHDDDTYRLHDTTNDAFIRRMEYELVYTRNVNRNLAEYLAEANRRFHDAQQTRQYPASGETRNNSDTSSVVDGDIVSDPGDPKGIGMNAEPTTLESTRIYIDDMGEFLAKVTPRVEAAIASNTEMGDLAEAMGAVVAQIDRAIATLRAKEVGETFLTQLGSIQERFNQAKEQLKKATEAGAALALAQEQFSAAATVVAALSNETTGHARAAEAVGASSVGGIDYMNVGTNR